MDMKEGLTDTCSFKRIASNDGSALLQPHCPNFFLRNSLKPNQNLKKEKNIILIYPTDTPKPLKNSLSEPTPPFQPSRTITSNMPLDFLSRIRTLKLENTSSQSTSSTSFIEENETVQRSKSKLDKIASKSKHIKPTHKTKIPPSKKPPNKKIYEISRFFVKNYIGALKSTLNSPNCEHDMSIFLGMDREQLIKIRQELEKLLKEFPKHNRMQLYKLITNPILNPVFQYFLRRKVYSWIFTSTKMQDKHAHLMARKNFLHLCLKAKDLTPYNFRIALNLK